MQINICLFVIEFSYFSLYKEHIYLKIIIKLETLKVLTIVYGIMELVLEMQ